MSENQLKVENIRGFESLWSMNKPIVIPDFQRAYAWTEKNLMKLIEDFRSFSQNRQKHDLADVYFMGAILLFDNGETFEVIDGQQRLTTLVILNYVLNKDNFPEKCKFSFTSPISIELINKAKIFFANEINESEKNILRELLTKLEFTVTVTENQDDAFIFFDTQNSRGVKLKATELLKAHHLREINGISGQNEAAKRWESLELLRMNYGTEAQSNSELKVIDQLFDHYLYHSRVWVGKVGKRVEFLDDFIEYEQRDALMQEFGSKTIKCPDNSVRLYPHGSNQHVHSIEIDMRAQNGQGEYLPEYRYRAFKHTPLSIPFSLRQPVDKGMGYFLFVEKYAQLLQYLTNVSDNYLKEFDAFNSAIMFHPHNSKYARRFYMLCILSYFDKFGENGLIKFALYLEFLIGAVRLENDRLAKNSLTNVYLRDADVNLLDMIFNAYTPEQLFEWMMPLIKKQSIKYQNKGKGVQKSYLDNMRRYYGKGDNDDASSKLTWLNEKVKSL